MDDNTMKPTVRNEFNWNTILILGSIFMIIFGGGAAWQSVRADVNTNAKTIERVRTDVDSMKEKSGTFDMYGYRITALESGAAAIVKSQRDLDRSIAQVQSDVRVIRQMLEQREGRTLEPYQPLPQHQ